MSAAQAKSIFFDLLEIPSDEHERYIERVCRDDATLADRVRGLIRAHLSADVFLGGVDLPHTMGASAEAGATVHPEQIGPYWVIKPIGQGGFGSVYLCQQSEPIERMVAVKVLRPGMDTGSALRRFEEERLLLARMDHPGIARVLDAGKTSDARSYIVMEYIDGEIITQYCDRHKLRLRDRLGLMIQACNAVQHAHQKGVLHRDLKPGNVLVSTVDGKAVVKIIDFGVSKAFGVQASDRPDDPDQMITRTMQLVGTPQYMSPEQASTEPGDIDTRSDVYALGVMLYELATGVQPFDPEKMRSASAAQLERLIREVDPPRPSTRVAQLDQASVKQLVEQQASPIGQIIRGLRGEIDWIVSKAMEKGRERRYPTAFALGEDIERALRGEPTRAGPTSRVYMLRKLIGRNRAAATVAAALVLSLLSITVLSVISANRVARANAEIRTTLSNQERVLRFSEDLLSGIDPAIARGKDTELLQILLAAASDRIDDEIDGAPEVGVRVRSMVGTLYWDIGEYDRAIEKLVAAVALGESELGSTHPLTIQAKTSAGAVYAEMTQYEPARNLLERAVSDAQSTLGGDDPQTLIAMSNLGSVYSKLGMHDESIRVHRDLLVQRVRVLGDQDQDTMATRNGLANELMSTGETEEASELLRLVLDHQLGTIGEDHPNTLKTRTNLASLYAQLGENERAIEMNTEVLAQKRRVLGDEHPSVLVSMVNLARLLESSSEPARARSLLDEGLEIALRTLGPTHQYTLTIQNNLANLLARQESFEDALPYQQAAREGLVELLGAAHPVTIQCTGNLVNILIKLGRTEEALAMGIENVATARGSLKSSEPGLAKQIQGLAKVYASNGDLTQAQALAQEAAELIRTIHGQDSDAYRQALTLLDDAAPDN